MNFPYASRSYPLLSAITSVRRTLPEARPHGQKGNQKGKMMMRGVLKMPVHAPEGVLWALGGCNPSTDQSNAHS